MKAAAGRHWRFTTKIPNSVCWYGKAGEIVVQRRIGHSSTESIRFDGTNLIDKEVVEMPAVLDRSEARCGSFSSGYREDATISVGGKQCEALSKRNCSDGRAGHSLDSRHWQPGAKSCLRVAHSGVNGAVSTCYEQGEAVVPGDRGYQSTGRGCALRDADPRPRETLLRVARSGVDGAVRTGE